MNKVLMLRSTRKSSWWTHGFLKHRSRDHQTSDRLSTISVPRRPLSMTRSCYNQQSFRNFLISNRLTYCIRYTYLRPAVQFTRTAEHQLLYFCICGTDSLPLGEWVGKKLNSSQPTFVYIEVKVLSTYRKSKESCVHQQGDLGITGQVSKRLFWLPLSKARESLHYLPYFTFPPLHHQCSGPSTCTWAPLRLSENQ